MPVFLVDLAELLVDLTELLVYLTELLVDLADLLVDLAEFFIFKLRLYRSSEFAVAVLLLFLFFSRRSFLILSCLSFTSVLILVSNV